MLCQPLKRLFSRQSPSKLAVLHDLFDGSNSASSNTRLRQRVSDTDSRLTFFTTWHRDCVTAVIWAFQLRSEMEAGGERYRGPEWFMSLTCAGLFTRDVLVALSRYNWLYPCTNHANTLRSLDHWHIAVAYVVVVINKRIAFIKYTLTVPLGRSFEAQILILVIISGVTKSAERHLEQLLSKQVRLVRMFWSENWVDKVLNLYRSSCLEIRYKPRQYLGGSLWTQSSLQP